MLFNGTAYSLKSFLEHPDGVEPLAESIAIVGLGGVFPGARTLSDFWRLIERGEDTSRPVPAGRWILDPAAIHNPQAGAPDQVYTDRGCFIDDFDLDPAGLDLPAGLVSALDPAVRLLLSAGRDAWGGAQLASADRRRAGIILGNIALPTAGASAWCERILMPLFEQRLFGRSEPLPPLGSEALNRYVTGLPAGLLARALGLGGGTYTLDAACASSLYAVKQACDELLAGRADVMLAGGLSRPDSLYTQMGFCQLRALATSGRCAPFDAAASGLIVGEGAGIVVLKRLSDALRDGDRIRALIRGAGLSNDLDGNLLSPSAEGQLRALRQAYRQAGWTPDQVDLIECHATGTPVGDAVEFASLMELWQGSKWQPGQCALGAVKANIGHLLTAAGGASLIKVLLALEHDTLPAVANFQRPGTKIPLDGSPFRILRESQPWLCRDDGIPRRAAINGFGFGGINAHVLIEEWIGQEEPRTRTSVSLSSPASASVPVAIVGMAVRVGRCPNLRAFQERVLSGECDAPSEPTSWRGVPWEEMRAAQGQVERSFPGYYLEDISIPMGLYRIPPKELAELLPQQALMLETSRAALEDAHLPAADPARTGVYIGLGLDARTTDFHWRWSMRAHAATWADRLFPGADAELKEAWKKQLIESAGPQLTADRTLGSLAGICASRVAKEFHFGGPSHTVGNEECSGLRALEIAVRALQQGELDRALAGAVDMAGDPRSLEAARSVRPGDAAGMVSGEGAVALVLKRLEDAQRDGDRVYAVICGVGAATGQSAGENIFSPEACEQALERAYREAGIDPTTVGYVDTSEASGTEGDCREAEVLSAYFGSAKRSTVCRLGSAQSEVGHTGAAAGLVSIVKASLALYQEILPPSRALGRSKSEEGERQNLTVPLAPQYWLRNREEGARRAGVSCASLDGNCLHVVLEACECQPDDGSKAQGKSPTTKPIGILAERREPLGQRNESLFVLRASDAGELLKQLSALRAWISAEEGEPLGRVARRWWREHKVAPGAGGNLAMIAKDSAQLARLIALATDWVRSDEPRAPLSDSRDRDRVFYSTSARRVQGSLAFVYPGSGNQFAGMGRDLALEWPEILRAQDRENSRLAGQLFADEFWNAATDEELTRDHRVLICGQVSLGAMVSDLAVRFGLKPEAAIGYSLGESTALFALRAWTDRDDMLRRVSESPLFARDLAGDPVALARTWKLAPGESAVWQAGLVDRPAEAVTAAMAGNSRVYVLIINTPGECVIGGEASSVRDVVARLGCHWWPLDGVSTVHCELLKPVEKAYREMHWFSTTAPAGVRFYSGGWGRAYVPDRETAADAIVAQASGCIDFPRVIRAAYDAGVRLFVEMGPGNSCSRMIGKILEGRPHVARSLCASAQEPVLGVLRGLGCLAAEGVAVDLGLIYGEEEFPAEARRRGEEGKKVASCVRIPIAGADWLTPPAPLRMGKKGSKTNSIATPASSIPAGGFTDDFELAILGAMTASQTATLEAHKQYLDFSQGMLETLSRTVQSQIELLTTAGAGVIAVLPPNQTIAAPSARPVALDRAACLEFARGSVAQVLGAAFSEVDSYPTRVRLPDEPLMLVDRILEIDAEPLSMTHGRVVTEHDVLPGAWYLDCGRIPTCVAVEAGQADLFLSGYLGIDSRTRGLAVYRLLDARVCFHRGLPGPGSTIHYDIRIERFFRQSDTWLFHFHFEATVDGQPLLTMTDGCAGFFSAAALAGGRGIVRPAIEQRTPHNKGNRASDKGAEFTPMAVEAYSSGQLDALRAGDLAACFGPAFAHLPLQRPLTLPGGRMRLVHRIVELDPNGGLFGLGLIRGEADIHHDDWFLLCHFVDDRVMPGTLMYECCLHTLRVYLLRLGWVVDQGQAVLEPVPELPSQLKCRGQVLETTRVVTYEISLKEIGFRPEPYVVADALMYADGKPIVEIGAMNLRYSGVTRDTLQATWAAKGRRESVKRVLFDQDRILAFAIGKPSVAFGEPYRVFDEQRRIARLPGPPYQFLDRIVEITNAAPFQLAAGGVVEAEYDIPSDAWYFEANRQGDMPFAVLLEIALQPCGWLAAYVGSALASAEDLSFRNLGGNGIQHVPVWPHTGTLSTRIKLTRLSSSAGMILQWFDLEVHAGAQLVYQGDTYFGFFPKASLQRQEGIKNAPLWQANESSGEAAFDYPREIVADTLRMIDRVECYLPAGGPQGLGFIRGTKVVNPDEWFFKAHFYQDPVTPGSLGLESFLQLLKYLAMRRWGSQGACRWEAVALGTKHEWVYRGQIVPGQKLVTVEAVVTHVDEAGQALTADGFLSVDGRVIYAMKNFTVRRQPAG